MDYYCKKCGFKAQYLNNLLNECCSKGGKHELYTGKESGPFHCKKCGWSSPYLMNLLNECCSKGGKHEPLE